MAENDADIRSNGGTLDDALPPGPPLHAGAVVDAAPSALEAGVSAPSAASAPAGKGRVLELAPSEPELEGPPSVASVDALLDELADPVASEDHEPVARMLPRAAMRRSVAPPPLPTKVSSGGGARSSKRSVPPPLPPPLPLGPSALAPPPPPLLARSAARPPSPLTRAKPGSLPPPLPRSVSRAPGLELLNARIASLEAEESQAPLARARALSERAIVYELTEEDDLSIASAEEALSLEPRLAGMHALLRRKRHRAGAAVLLGHVDEEVPAAAEGPARTSLLAERARLLGATDRHEDALTAWSYVLANDRGHAAALRGKEAALAEASDEAPDVWEARAAHLGVMADAYTSDPRTAAWLQVERASILEARLGDVDSARRALTRALTLDPRVGPVRRALVRLVSRQGDAAALVDLLDEEGRIEADPARAARLELEAASIAEGAMRDLPRSIALLERAAARGKTTDTVDRRVLDDLTRLLEATGRAPDALRWRRARLSLLPGADARAEELRALARGYEGAGDLDRAIADLELSLEEEVEAATLTHLDRLLDAAGRHEPRVALWLKDAMTDVDRVSDPTKRVASLVRAAFVAERDLGRVDEAVRHLRTAWTTQPGHPEVLESLTRLLARPTRDVEAAPRLELYAHAAAVTEDRGRRVAYLEKVALIAEETLADFARARGAYEEILAVEPANLGALLGLGRVAAHEKDDRTLYRVLMAQARASRSETDSLALQTRAALAIAKVDPELALRVAGDVLAADASHEAGRALVTRLHEDSGRWELVARSVEERLAHASTDQRRTLLLYLAFVLEVHLKAPLEALATLQRARESQPESARTLASIARVLESVPGPHALRDAYENLARGASTEEERARHLVRAAELSEHQLSDDAAALRAYEEALLASPRDALIEDRLERVRARSKENGPSHPLDRALDLVTTGDDDARALAIVESLTGDESADPVPVLRLLERIHRRARARGPLASVLERQADAFASSRPKLGALWTLAALEEWELEAKTEATPEKKVAHGTYTKILALEPDDPEALLAVVRTRLPEALANDGAARRAVIEALEARAPLETEGSRVATELVLAHLLEAESGEADATLALERYRFVLALDPTSVTAAWGMRRLAHRLGRIELAVEAGSALAELTVEHRARGRLYFEAAELAVSAGDAAGLGDARARHSLTGDLLESALAADPDNVAAAGALSAQRSRGGEHEALLRAFRPALERARDEEAVIFLGTEVARVARDELHDLVVATAAMQRVKDVAPAHAPSRLMLAELYIAQRAWPEAVEMLEAVVRHAGDAEQRLTALFALGSIYDKVLGRKDELERVLRAALAIEPENPRALRGLVDHLRARSRVHASGDRSADPSADGSTNAQDAAAFEAPEAGELRALLHRLAGAESDHSKQCDAYLEVADLEAAVGDRAAAERSLIQAIVRCPANARAFARLAAFFRRGTGEGVNAAAYAHALQDLIARGRDAGHADPRWFAALGQLEVDTLQRLHDGVAHLEWAVQLDPTLYETRFELADAYAKTGAREPAIRTLLSLFMADARPLLSLADAGLALALLERLFEQDKKPEEAVVVSELRALQGELEPGREAWLRARKLAAFEEHHTPLARATLVQDALPKAGRHVLLEVAAASAGLDAKLLRTNLGELGVQTKDRVGARSGHPLRAAFDRASKALGVTDVELALSNGVDRVRVLTQDTPWVVVPPSFESLPGAVQVAALSRACAGILLGVPWLKELRDSAILGWLVAVARQVVTTYGAEERDAIPPEAASFEPLVAKAIGRRQKKLLDPLVPALSSRDGRPPELGPFLRALDQCTVRAAYLVTGDLHATVGALALDDAHLSEALARPGLPQLSALLMHPLAGDLVRFALTPDATLQRQRLASTWAR